MFSIRQIKGFPLRRALFSTIPLMTLILVLITLGAPGLRAQDQPKPDSTNQQDTPPEAGGPQSDVGPYAIPKKKEEPPPPPPTKPKKIEGMPDYSLKVDVPLVDLDVSVLTKN